MSPVVSDTPNVLGYSCIVHEARKETRSEEMEVFAKVKYEEVHCCQREYRL